MDLRAERELLKRKLAAIEVLLEESGDAPTGRRAKRGSISEATRRKISAAAKARWKAVKAKQAKT